MIKNVISDHKNFIVMGTDKNFRNVDFCQKIESAHRVGTRTLLSMCRNDKLNINNSDKYIFTNSRLYNPGML